MRFATADPPPLPAEVPTAHGRLNVDGDGSPDADLLVDAAEHERLAAVARLEAQFPGCDVGAMGRRSGTETTRLLRDLGPDSDRFEVMSAIDRFASRGDLIVPRAGIVHPNDSHTHPIPTSLLTAGEPDGSTTLEPFLGRRALDATRTFVYNTMEGEFPDAVHDTVEDLATALRSQVQVNAYVSRGVAPGFGLHWDDHDVLVTQMQGRKYWEIRQPTTIGAVRHFSADHAEGEVAWSGILEPGWALWIPRGWAHAVKGFEGDTSVHITYGIKRPNLVELLALLDRERFHDIVRDLGPDDVAHAMADWRSRVVSLPRQGLISTSALIDAAFAGARLRTRLIGGTVFAVDHCDDQQLVLIANRRQVSLPRAAAATLAWMLEHPWCTVDEIAAAVGRDDVSLPSVLTGFGDAGLLHVLPAHPGAAGAEAPT